jgi:type VI secretion system VasD/TssJ family lipoprotein
MKIYNYAVFVLPAALVVLVACAGELEPPMPVNKTLSIQAGPNVNQYNNSVNPIVLRIYQLSSRSEFEAASFWDIFNNNAPDLVGVVLDKRSLSPLYPGETRLVAFDLEPDVFYIGAFAEFADFETQQFRAAVPIDEERLDNGVTISVTSSGVTIQFRRPSDSEESEPSEERKGLFAKLFGGLFGGGE